MTTTQRPLSVVVGLGFGDEGKGSITNALVRQTGASLVVRWNGGAQAAHRVVLPDGREHIFSQLGSGAFVSGVETWHTAAVALDLFSLRLEGEALSKKGVSRPLAQVWVEPDTPLITPWHRLLNRLEELVRGPQRHGSCGMGVGQTLLDAAHPERPGVRVRDLRDPRLLRTQLEAVAVYKKAQAEPLLDLLSQHTTEGMDRAIQAFEAELKQPALVERVVDNWMRFLTESGIRIGSRQLLRERLSREAAVFEGAQGVLLDPQAGFFPHVTASQTTLAPVWELLEGQARARVECWGVLRAYQTRHGAGPLPTERAEDTRKLPDPANGAHPWQGGFRVGPLDLPLTRHALAAVPDVERLALTCVDRLADWEEVRLCTHYLEGWPEAGEGRTEALQHAKPVYSALPGWTSAALQRWTDGQQARLPRELENFVAHIETGLDKRLAWLSTGTTFLDKRVLH